MTDPPRTAPLSTMQSYRHYRGGTYTLLYIAENSEDRSELLAVYVSHLTRKVLVRPWAMFREDVVWPDGQRRPRFLDVELAPEFPAEHSAEFYQQVAMYHALAEEAAEAHVVELQARVVELEWKLAAPPAWVEQLASEWTAYVAETRVLAERLHHSNENRDLQFAEAEAVEECAAALRGRAAKEGT